MEIASLTDEMIRFIDNDTALLDQVMVIVKRNPKIRWLDLEDALSNWFEERIETAFNNPNTSESRFFYDLLYAAIPVIDWQSVAKHYQAKYRDISLS